MKVKDKAALVTGGAQGLGKGFSKILLQNGAKVLFTDVNADVGKNTEKEFQREFGQGNVLFVKADVTSDDEMAEAFRLAKSSFGRLDIVVNNAGTADYKDLWERCISINLAGTIRCTRLAMQYLRQDRGGEGGVIVNISSQAGLSPAPYNPVYSATKAGLIMYARSLVATPGYSDNGVRINVLCPSVADTPLTQGIFDDSVPNVDKNFSESLSIFKEMVGLLSVEELAEAFMELITDDDMNGEVLLVVKSQGKTYVTF